MDFQNLEKLLIYGAEIVGFGTTVMIPIVFGGINLAFDYKEKKEQASYLDERDYFTASK